jgi:hypothetical protein
LDRDISLHIPWVALSCSFRLRDQPKEQDRPRICFLSVILL